MSVYINIGINIFNIIRFKAISRLLHHNSVMMSVVGKWEYNMRKRSMQVVDNSLSSTLKISIPKHRKYSTYLLKNNLITLMAIRLSNFKILY